MRGAGGGDGWKKKCARGIVVSCKKAALRFYGIVGSAVRMMGIYEGELEADCKMGGKEWQNVLMPERRGSRAGRARRHDCDITRMVQNVLNYDTYI